MHHETKLVLLIVKILKTLILKLQNKQLPDIEYD